MNTSNRLITDYFNYSLTINKSDVINNTFTHSLDRTIRYPDNTFITRVDITLINNGKPIVNNITSSNVIIREDTQQQLQFPAGYYTLDQLFASINSIANISFMNYGEYYGHCHLGDPIDFSQAPEIQRILGFNNSIAEGISDHLVDITQGYELVNIYSSLIATTDQQKCPLATIRVEDAHENNSVTLYTEIPINSFYIQNIVYTFDNGHGIPFTPNCNVRINMTLNTFANVISDKANEAYNMITTINSSELNNGHYIKKLDSPIQFSADDTIIKRVSVLLDAKVFNIDTDQTVSIDRKKYTVPAGSYSAEALLALLNSFGDAVFYYIADGEDAFKVNIKNITSIDFTNAEQLQSVLGFAKAHETVIDTTFKYPVKDTKISFYYNDQNTSDAIYLEDGYYSEDAFFNHIQERFSHYNALKPVFIAKGEKYWELSSLNRFGFKGFSGQTENFKSNHFLKAMQYGQYSFGGLLTSMTIPRMTLCVKYFDLRNNLISSHQYVINSLVYSRSDIIKILKRALNNNSQDTIFMSNGETIYTNSNIKANLEIYFDDGSKHPLIEIPEISSTNSYTLPQIYYQRIPRISDNFHNGYRFSSTKVIEVDGLGDSIYMKSDFSFFVDIKDNLGVEESHQYTIPSGTYTMKEYCDHLITALNQNAKGQWSYTNTSRIYTFTRLSSLEVQAKFSGKGTHGPGIITGALLPPNYVSTFTIKQNKDTFYLDYITLPKDTPFTIQVLDVDSSPRSFSIPKGSYSISWLLENVRTLVRTTYQPIIDPECEINKFNLFLSYTQPTCVRIERNYKSFKFGGELFDKYIKSFQVTKDSSDSNFYRVIHYAYKFPSEAVIPAGYYNFEEYHEQIYNSFKNLYADYNSLKNLFTFTKNMDNNTNTYDVRINSGVKFTISNVYGIWGRTRNSKDWAYCRFHLEELPYYLQAPTEDLVLEVRRDATSTKTTRYQVDLPANNYKSQVEYITAVGNLIESVCASHFTLYYDTDYFVIHCDTPFIVSGSIADRLGISTNVFEPTAIVSYEDLAKIDVTKVKSESTLNITNNHENMLIYTTFTKGNYCFDRTFICNFRIENQEGKSYLRTNDLNIPVKTGSIDQIDYFLMQADGQTPFKFSGNLVISLELQNGNTEHGSLIFV